MHLKRILSGLILLPLGLALILWSPPRLFATAACLVAVGGGWEFFTLATARGLRPVWPTGLLAVVLLPAAAYAGGVAGTVGALAVATAGTLAWIALSPGEPATALIRAGVTALGATYVGGLMAFALLMRQEPGGPTLLLAAACITWTGDTAAFYGGRRLGRRPLAPAISPGKTVEGAALGLAASMAVAAVGSRLLWTGGVLSWMAAGGLVGLGGQAGDLAESLLKRSLGAKESGWIIPGHGGLLDRIDSLLFAVPVLFGLARLGLIP